MTDTKNGWPDKPGVPTNPGLPGAHWIKGYTEDVWMYDGDGGWWVPGYSHNLDAGTVAARYSYLGPCLTLDEAAALQARIAELEAALATARREGMEEAARIAENEPEPEGEPPIELHGRSVKNIAISSVRATKHSIAAAIRAALEGKKDG